MNARQTEDAERYWEDLLQDDESRVEALIEGSNKKGYSLLHNFLTDYMDGKITDHGAAREALENEIRHVLWEKAERDVLDGGY